MPEIEYVWHGRRYWTSEPKLTEKAGWNTRFEPCFVLRQTAKRIYIKSPTFGEMQLNREAFERDGKVYHSRVHEYFYNTIPPVDPEHREWKGWGDWLSSRLTNSDAFATLGLKPGCSREDIKRAYKQKARNCHPDSGGSHDAFIKLRQAYESAMNQL